LPRGLSLISQIDSYRLEKQRHTDSEVNSLFCILIERQACAVKCLTCPSFAQSRYIYMHYFDCLKSAVRRKQWIRRCSVNITLQSSFPVYTRFHISLITSFLPLPPYGNTRPTFSPYHLPTYVRRAILVIDTVSPSSLKHSSHNRILISNSTIGETQR
jgi:hypothetical protein